MKRLIKISDYYYVVDDKAEIKEWYLTPSNNTFLYHGNELIPKGSVAIIAQCNSHINLPQITNPSDKLVGKEVEVEFDTLYEPEDLHNVEYAIIKPISKETSFNSCATCKYFHTECIERQRKYNATSNNECWEENKTSTNETFIECKSDNDYNTTIGAKTIEDYCNLPETLEEVAYSIIKQRDVVSEFCNHSDYDVWVKGFLEGYKYAESKKDLEYLELQSKYSKLYLKTLKQTLSI